MNSMMPYTPEQSIEMVQALSAIVQKMRAEMFKPDVDFGVIPGTSKPTLLLPGMEKLMRALRLRAEYISTEKMIDFENGIFFYEYECRLSEVETGLCVSTAIGSANSRETKWRYRNAERVCPNCGKAAIIKGKEEYGGGWVCFTKKEGCNSKFKDNDPAIANQAVGRIENPDIADQVNTISKIAQKRALASAIKCAANVSEFFTVDIEDMPQYNLASFSPPRVDSDGVIDVNFEVVTPPKTEQKAAPTKPATQSASVLDTGFSVETGRNFLGWAKRNYDLSEEGVSKILDAISNTTLASITQFPGTVLDAVSGVMLADLRVKNIDISDALKEMSERRNKFIAPHGKPFTLVEVEMIGKKMNELAKGE